MKRLFGFLLIGLSVLLILAFLVNIKSVFMVVGGVVRIITGKTTAEEAGWIFGYGIGLLIQIIITIFLFQQGRRLSKKSKG